ncbi:MAG: ribbon-helix-helix protein, CopG family [Aeromicrobium sp.]|nr:ribbon-helix-helix protein, CopG family [Aeromicrobium sp.]
MGRMVRKQLYIDDKQEAALKRHAKERGVTEAELVREALDVYLAQVARGEADAAWERIMELSERQAAKGPVPGKRDWTRDELYDRPKPRPGRGW